MILLPPSRFEANRIAALYPGWFILIPWHQLLPGQGDIADANEFFHLIRQHQIYERSSAVQEEMIHQLHLGKTNLWDYTNFLNLALRANNLFLSVERSPWRDRNFHDAIEIRLKADFYKAILYFPLEILHLLENAKRYTRLGDIYENFQRKNRDILGSDKVSAAQRRIIEMFLDAIYLIHTERAKWPSAEQSVTHLAKLADPALDALRVNPEKIDMLIRLTLTTLDYRKIEQRLKVLERSGSQVEAYHLVAEEYAAGFLSTLLREMATTVVYYNAMSQPNVIVHLLHYFFTSTTRLVRLVYLSFRYLPRVFLSVRHHLLPNVRILLFRNFNLLSLRRVSMSVRRQGRLLITKVPLLDASLGRLLDLLEKRERYVSDTTPKRTDVAESREQDGIIWVHRPIASLSNIAGRIGYIYDPARSSLVNQDGHAPGMEAIVLGNPRLAEVNYLLLRLISGFLLSGEETLCRGDPFLKFILDWSYMNAESQVELEAFLRDEKLMELLKTIRSQYLSGTTIHSQRTVTRFSQILERYSNLQALPSHAYIHGT